MTAINHFAKQDHITVEANQKQIYKKSSRVLLTITNQTFFSNKFKTPTYTFAFDRNAKIHELFLCLATKLMVDPNLFRH